MTREDPDAVAEKERLLREVRRREAELPPDLYAPWQAAESFMRAERRRQAARMLRRAGVFPGSETPCLEIGYGRLGWLGDLISWGVRETRLAGIELDAVRAACAQGILPAADLRVGDAGDMPWSDGTFRLAVASTVFTSVLDPGSRHRLAGEIERVLSPGGALLWYDFRVNPRNAQVRAIGRRELRALFPGLRGDVRSVTLAPPLLRRIAPWSHLLATVLERLPVLRSHLIAVLVKGGVA
jgi:SAM-dependent methyltransferase